MTRIESLIPQLLDENEMDLASHLGLLLADDSYDAESLVGDILPVYWRRVGDIAETLEPDNIYRPLYYLHAWSSRRDFRQITRGYMQMMSSHLEGCLNNLRTVRVSRRGASGPFGTLVERLHNEQVLNLRLVEQLRLFNRSINVPSKHFTAYTPIRSLDKRTFSVNETALAFVLMRRLSIELFSVLKSFSVVLPEHWPSFSGDWLSWEKKINGCD